MSTEAVKANLIWENNSDTPLSSENLSKMLDYQSEIKFINFTDSRYDYEAWADLVFENITDDFSYYLTKDYQDQVIYNLTTHTAKKITEDTDGLYYAASYSSPYKKLLKVLSKTKIAMSYEKSGVHYYNSFDVGASDKTFSCDHLISGTDFLPNRKYEIYLYYHISYGDHAQIKIMEASDSSWKTTSPDISSPSGYKLISYRKIGGFSTDANGFIKESSIWDISTMHSEIVVETLKKYDSTTGEIRSLVASDIPILDSENIITATNVEGAIEEIKLKVDNIFDDLYSVDKYGMELKFCPIKSNGSSYSDCITNELTLKITAGYIDVYGTRIKFPTDVYLSTAKVKVNTSTSYANPAFLGASTALNAVYDSSADGSGTIWRVFIDIGGNILLKEASVASPRYIYNGKLKGWYIINPVARCIGKFKVKKSAINFIEKQSVTNTVERQMIPNEIIIMHGTVCPDGTVPCDGKWHDVVSDDGSNAYTARPPLAMWGSSWYEETPYLWGKVLRMASSNTLSANQFKLDANGMVTQGGCAETGATGGSNTHTHLHPHTHRPGTLKIDEVSGSGEHDHDYLFIGLVDETSYVVEDPLRNGVIVTKNTHDHTLAISGGIHAHTSESFSGATASISGSDAITDPESSWAPYKEVLYCIKA